MKSLQRGRFLRLAAGAAALPVMSQVANAEAYPSRPVRRLVGFAPGGGTDVIARLPQPVLSERLGQQIVIAQDGAFLRSPPAASVIMAH
jgi:tripartite-type tricarboxylate transporter receptor subunit TctC